MTSVVITHDMVSAFKVADRIAMLYEGRIVDVGTPDEIRNSKNPIVQQFIHGEADGPDQELVANEDSNMKRELKIGIFVAGTFLILAPVHLHRRRHVRPGSRRSGYELIRSFQIAPPGWRKQAAVKMAGVKIGYVKDIRLADRKAQVVMSIFARHQGAQGLQGRVWRPSGSSAKNTSRSRPATGRRFLDAGGVLETTAPVSFDQIGAVLAVRSATRSRSLAGR